MAACDRVRVIDSSDEFRPRKYRVNVFGLGKYGVPCVPVIGHKVCRDVLDAGRELWRYYHAQPNANPNASYYDIRLHFQGSTTDAKGKVRMNSDSPDAKYTELIANLRAAMKPLARRMEPKVYEYGFLKR